MTEPLLCSRCGRAPRDDEPLLLIVRLPAMWEGPPPVCPGCQLAGRHPLCGSFVDAHSGKRVDPEVDWATIPREEWDFGSLRWCEYRDLTAEWFEGEVPPKGWTCPVCGGKKFMGIKRDFPLGGLPPPGTPVVKIDDE